MPSDVRSPISGACVAVALLCEEGVTRGSMSEPESTGAAGKPQRSEASAPSFKDGECERVLVAEMKQAGGV